MLPAVASMITPPGFSRPSASAASIMVRAIRSLIEPPGLALSSLVNSRQGPQSNIPVSSSTGVRPIRSSAEVTGAGACVSGAEVLAAGIIDRPTPCEGAYPYST